MGTKPSVLPTWHITIRLPFERDAKGYIFLYCLTKPSVLYCQNQTMFHPSRQLDNPMIGIFQSAVIIPTSMQLSLGSPLGLCDYIFFDI